MSLPEKEEDGYFSLFVDSWKKIWECKTLWFFGFLLAFLGENIFSSETTETSKPELLNSFSEQEIIERIKQGMTWLSQNYQFFFWFVVVFIIVGFFLFFLNVRIRGGLILFLAKGKKKDYWKKNWQEVWQEGKKTFNRLLFLDLFFLFLVFSLMFFWLIFSGGIGVWMFFVKSLFWKKLFFGIIILFSFLTFCLGVFLFLNKLLVDFLVVILERKTIDAFIFSSRILKEKSKEVLKLLGLLILAALLSQWVFQIIIFFLKVFLSGVYLVFHIPWQVIGSNRFLVDEKSFFWSAIYFCLSIFISGLYNLFSIDFRIIWLKKNGIIRIQKKKEEKEVLEKELELASLGVVKMSSEKEELETTN